MLNKWEFEQAIYCFEYKFSSSQVQLCLVQMRAGRVSEGRPKIIAEITVAEKKHFS